MKMDWWRLAMIRQLIRTEFEQFKDKQIFLIEFMNDNK